jgi:hypothetical protein
LQVGARRDLELFDSLNQNAAPQRVALDERRAALAAEIIVVMHLDAFESLRIAADESDQLRGQLTLGIVPIRLVGNSHALDIEGPDPLGFFGRHLPLDPHERFIGREFLNDRRRIHAESLSQALGRGPRLFDAMGASINRLPFEAQCERLAGAVENRAALGQNDPFLEMLFLSQQLELFALEDLQLKGAQRDG